MTRAAACPILRAAHRSRCLSNFTEDCACRQGAVCGTPRLSATSFGKLTAERQAEISRSSHPQPPQIVTHGYNPSSACRRHGPRWKPPDGKEVLHESCDLRSACHDTPKLEPACCRAQTPGRAPSETLRGVDDATSIPAIQGAARVRSKRRCSPAAHAPVHARLTPRDIGLTILRNSAARAWSGITSVAPSPRVWTKRPIDRG